MKFKDFLQEARHRRDISIEFALELLHENCKDALSRVKTPLWRGTRNATEEAYLMQPEAGERTSNNKNREYASNYGAIYALFPYDGVKIGVASKRDLWDTESFKLGHSKIKRPLEDWNYWFRTNIIDAGDDYQELKENIIRRLDRPAVKEVFGSADEVEDILRAAYSPENLKLNLSDTKSMGEFEDKQREVWLSGKCVAFHVYTWEDLIHDGTLK